MPVLKVVPCFEDDDPLRPPFATDMVLFLRDDGPRGRSSLSNSDIIRLRFIRPNTFVFRQSSSVELQPYLPSRFAIQLGYCQSQVGNQNTDLARSGNTVSAARAMTRMLILALLSQAPSWAKQYTGPMSTSDAGVSRWCQPAFHAPARFGLSVDRSGPARCFPMRRSMNKTKTQRKRLSKRCEADASDSSTCCRGFFKKSYAYWIR